MYTTLKLLRGRRIGLLSALMAALLAPLTRPALAAPFDCTSQACNLRSEGSYPHFVVGTVKAVASEAQARKIYRWAQNHGYWRSLVDDEDGFIRFVQVLSVEVPGEGAPAPFSLLMGREEYDTSPILPGDLVRYTPHRIAEPMSLSYATAVARSYWDLFGCIAVLCRADDSACPKRYVQGVYRVDDGVQLNSLNAVPADGGRRIDTQTYLPLQADASTTGK